MAPISSPVLVDVLCPDSYKSEHIPGAVNFCIYEVAFLDKIKAAYPDTSTSLRVYGLAEHSAEAKLAADRLKAAGYKNVDHLEGGLNGWKQGGNPTDGEGRKVPVVEGQRLINTEESFIHWIGRNPLNFHNGAIKLKQGFITLNHHALANAEFTIDMKSITDEDLTDSVMNKMLIHHLASDDFFDIETYPEAFFKITSADPIDGVPLGLPNYQIKGELTLRGKTEPIDFLAQVTLREDGCYIAQAMVDMDRTRWGVLYGSGKRFARLGPHLVNDIVHLHVKIVSCEK